MGLSREMNTKLKTAAEARGVEPTGETEPKLTEKAGPHPDKGNTTASTASQKPAGERSGTVSRSNAERHAKASEQSGVLVENKGAASENKAETKQSPAWE